MQTINKQDLTTLTLNRELLNDLLTGAMVAADKSKAALSKLGSVYLSVKDGKISATATDRYRLVNGVAPIDGPDMSEIQILVADVKRILTLIKDNKFAREITLTRVADTLSVAAAGNSLTINLMGENLPGIDNLFNKPTAPLSAISLNGDYLGSFAKVPSSNDTPKLDLEFTLIGDDKPGQIKIKIEHKVIAWNCLLMPMRGAN